jgi:hypothetical protein
MLDPGEGEDQRGELYGRHWSKAVAGLQSNHGIT